MNASMLVYVCVCVWGGGYGLNGITACYLTANECQHVGVCVCVFGVVVMG